MARRCCCCCGACGGRGNRVSEYEVTITGVVDGDECANCDEQLNDTFVLSRFVGGAQESACRWGFPDPFTCALEDWNAAGYCPLGWYVFDPAGNCADNLWLTAAKFADPFHLFGGDWFYQMILMATLNGDVGKSSLLFSTSAQGTPFDCDALSAEVLTCGGPSECNNDNGVVCTVGGGGATATVTAL